MSSPPPPPPPADEETLLQADLRFQRAVDQFNGADWYGCHDGFEELWHETQGPMRPVLQGMLQIAVAELHLESGNRRGATMLMGEGLGRLRRSDDVALGLNLVLLRDLAGVRLKALQTESDLCHLPLPRLELGRSADTAPVH